MAKDAKPKNPPTQKFLNYLGKEPVKIATSNLFIETETVPVDYMVGVTFSQIGGQELLGYGMIDLSGDEYITPIKDIYKINERFSSSNIMPMNTGSNQTDSQFLVNLDNYLLELNTDDITISDNLVINLNAPLVYIDSNYEHLIIEIDDLAAEDRLILEIDFVRFGDTL